MFTPGRTQDIVWTGTDLANTPEIQQWEEFNDEHVNDLEEVAF
jgi:hypothetical protein